MKTRIATKSLLIVLLLVTFLGSMATACPLCRDSAPIGSTGSGNPATPIFNASILWILAGFLLIAGLLILKIVGAIRSIETSHRFNPSESIEGREVTTFQDPADDNKVNFA